MEVRLREYNKYNMSKLKTPEWVERGPLDLEYKTYKMLQRFSELKRNVHTNLMKCLYEIDDTLDYLYRYDAQKATESTPVFPELMGLPFQDLELVFTSKEELETNDILDKLCPQAIDKFEELHTKCREIWREIEGKLKVSYIGNKKYFLSGGFVFITTPDDMLHIYFFNKPSKNFLMSWKDFKMQHIKSEKYSEHEYFKRLEELGDKKSDKILIKANLDLDTNVDGHAITVVNNMVFSLLHRDYAF